MRHKAEFLVASGVHDPCLEMDWLCHLRRVEVDVAIKAFSDERLFADAERTREALAGTEPASLEEVVEILGRSADRIELREVFGAAPNLSAIATERAVKGAGAQSHPIVNLLRAMLAPLVQLEAMRQPMATTREASFSERYVLAPDDGAWVDEEQERARSNNGIFGNAGTYGAVARRVTASRVVYAADPEENPWLPLQREIEVRKACLEREKQWYATVASKPEIPTAMFDSLISGLDCIASETMFTIGAVYLERAMLHAFGPGTMTKERLHAYIGCMMEIFGLATLEATDDPDGARSERVRRAISRERARQETWQGLLWGAERSTVNDLAEPPHPDSDPAAGLLWGPRDPANLLTSL